MEEQLEQLKQFSNRRGDPRMHRAVAARLADPGLSLTEALKIGGFDVDNPEKDGCPSSNNSGGGSGSNCNKEDDDNGYCGEDGVGSSTTNINNSKGAFVTLSQRKNQLSRRIRKAKQQINAAKRNADGTTADTDENHTSLKQEENIYSFENENENADEDCQINKNIAIKDGTYQHSSNSVSSSSCSGNGGGSANASEKRKRDDLNDDNNSNVMIAKNGRGGIESKMNDTDLTNNKIGDKNKEDNNNNQTSSSSSHYYSDQIQQKNTVGREDINGTEEELVERRKNDNASSFSDGGDGSSSRNGTIVASNDSKKKKRKNKSTIVNNGNDGPVKSGGAVNSLYLEQLSILQQEQQQLLLESQIASLSQQLQMQQQQHNNFPATAALQGKTKNVANQLFINHSNKSSNNFSDTATVTIAAAQQILGGTNSMNNNGVTNRNKNNIHCSGIKADMNNFTNSCVGGNKNTGNDPVHQDSNNHQINILQQMLLHQRNLNAKYLQKQEEQGILHGIAPTATSSNHNSKSESIRMDNNFNDDNSNNSSFWPTHGNNPSNPLNNLDSILYNNNSSISNNKRSGGTSINSKNYNHNGNSSGEIRNNSHHSNAPPKKRTSRRAPSLVSVPSNNHRRSSAGSVSSFHSNGSATNIDAFRRLSVAAAAAVANLGGAGAGITAANGSTNKNSSNITKNRKIECSKINADKNKDNGGCADFNDEHVINFNQIQYQKNGRVTNGYHNNNDISRNLDYNSDSAVVHDDYTHDYTHEDENNNNNNNPHEHDDDNTTHDTDELLETEQKMTMALDFHRAESAALIKRCMLIAGFNSQNTEECDDYYLQFAERAIAMEQKRVGRLIMFQKDAKRGRRKGSFGGSNTGNDGTDDDNGNNSKGRGYGGNTNGSSGSGSAYYNNRNGNNGSGDGGNGNKRGDDDNKSIETISLDERSRSCSNNESNTNHHHQSTTTSRIKKADIRKNNKHITTEQRYTENLHAQYTDGGSKRKNSTGSVNIANKGIQQHHLDYTNNDVCGSSGIPSRIIKKWKEQRRTQQEYSNLIKNNKKQKLHQDEGHLLLLSKAILDFNNGVGGVKTGVDGGINGYCTRNEIVDDIDNDSHDTSVTNNCQGRKIFDSELSMKQQREEDNKMKQMILLKKNRINQENSSNQANNKCNHSQGLRKTQQERVNTSKRGTLFKTVNIIETLNETRAYDV
eukprot:CAMPEP_0194435706 /NCGR_PEP_ID=MMETSP0176-20130528/90286_1 /TAXON_ID=216777 /ORGANISM="Proboscia alata, Strain PI-D3" /LENGTH=1193 /DNA_ID=CAMNT_0039255269 /DNA_START=35 /DNA_END=3616 /DNA_ORIENTATION=+